MGFLVLFFFVLFFLLFLLLLLLLLLLFLLLLFPFLQRQRGEEGGGGFDGSDMSLLFASPKEGRGRREGRNIWRKEEVSVVGGRGKKGKGRCVPGYHPPISSFFVFLSPSLNK